MFLQPNESELLWDANGPGSWDESRGEEISAEEAEKICLEMKGKMNEDQRKAFKKLLKAYEHPERNRLFFLDVSFRRR